MKRLFGEKKWLVIIVCILFYFWINERMLASQLASLYSDKVGIGFQCGVILMLIAFVYCIINFKELPSFRSFETTTFISLLVYINIVGFTVAVFSSDFDSSMLLGIVPPFLYYLMYGLSAKHDIAQFVAICMFAILIILFYNYNTSLAVLAEHWNQDSFEGGSASYFILQLIPFALCCKKKYLHYIAFIVGIALLVTSTKRGGAIAVVLMIIGYFYVERVSTVNKKLKQGILLRTFIFLVTLLFIALFVAESNILADLAVFEKFEETKSDGGSGRTVIWAKVLEMIFNSNIVGFIFGHGYGAVVKDSPAHISAHNDYLEAFYDYGFIGFSLLLLLVFRLIVLNRKLIKSKSIYAAPMITSLILFLIISFISHILIYFANLSIMAMFWGYVAGVTHRQEKY